MLIKMKPITTLLFALQVVTATAGDRILFCPSVILEGTNLLEGIEWTALKNDAVEHLRGMGGPHDAKSPNWRVRSKEPAPGYWMSSVKIDCAHEYLAGAWVRFENAKILLRHYGKDVSSHQFKERRIYLYSGFNAVLEPYFSEESLKKLKGDFSRWRPMYRLVSFSTPIENDRLRLWYGLYLAAGDLTFSEPFLIDVADADRSYTIDIETQRPIVRLEVIRTSTNDLCWQKTFPRPVTRFVGKVPNTADAFAELSEGEKLSGHVLIVSYADGVVERYAAPEEHLLGEVH